MLPILITLLALYVGLCAVVFVFQRRLVYFPDRNVRATPAAVGLAFEELRLSAADGVELGAWWIPAAPGSAAVIVCHGNAGNIGDRLHLALALHAMELGVLLFDYRGYGASDGEPTEQGLYLDAEAAWLHVVEERGVPAARVALLGESLGGAVAVELATRRAVGAIVLEASFTSLADVGARSYPYLPVRLLARERFASIEKVAGLRAPLLLVHSPQDTLVPFAHAGRLQAKAPAGARVIEVPGGHNGGGFTASAAAETEVRAFLRDALGAELER